MKQSVTVGAQLLWGGRCGCKNGRYGCTIVMSYIEINKAVSQWLLTFNLCVSVTWPLTCAFHIPCMHTPEIIDMHRGVCDKYLVSAELMMDGWYTHTRGWVLVALSQAYDRNKIDFILIFLMYFQLNGIQFIRNVVSAYSSVNRLFPDVDGCLKDSINWLKGWVLLRNIKHEMHIITKSITKCWL